MGSPLIWTIGHSTHPIEEFLELLTIYRIALVADVRLFPYSRRHPQFNTDHLCATLSRVSVGYRSMPHLGGRRKSQPDSLNTGWRNKSFRGYADYMQTTPFLDTLEQLMEAACTKPTAIMCAEAMPWRCHRSLIADALTVRGWDVQHILSPRSTQRHTLTSFATVIDGRLMYPGQSGMASPLLL